MATAKAATGVASIKGTVTRHVSESNFYFRATDPDEATLRHIDLDGHRAGVDELSAEKLSGRKSKFKAWTGDLPEVGADVSLELAEPFEG